MFSRNLGRITCSARVASQKAFSSASKAQSAQAWRYALGGTSVAVGAGLIAWPLLQENVRLEAPATTPSIASPVPAKSFPISNVPISPQYTAMVDYVRSLQQRITSSIESLEAAHTPSADSPAKFLHDSWSRANHGGEGMSCVLTSGRIIEKGGVNISIVHGLLPPRAIAQMKADHSVLGSVPAGTSLPYSACGLSLVLHPKNPMAPTVHMNIRYFETYHPDDLSTPLACWFGGGSDLTPSYLFEEDAVHFHQTLKAACDKHGEGYYPPLKAWCDRYFQLPHRGESRGIGGIFFDDLDPSSEIHKASARFQGEGKNPSGDEVFSFVKSVGDAFVPSYLPILEKRFNMDFTDEQKRWQQLRRGRYVEFNLVHDRGTKFGLMTPGARIESVLMSLPLTARWEYCPEIEHREGSEESKLLSVLKTPKEWI
ncbi:Coproporphyrinogen III oxidase CPO/HEM13 [Phaffia rhodozyma]|uniref:coproporphyrinogen oxidase n=1 Tax=Phaffia rhodozyma TaxID=264483 RepID=A0A0F7SFF8_PHARH|nr:Coproporphyrinogen III oxidase CPO/HEM13 [Phaffia rhodozyma]